MKILLSFLLTVVLCSSCSEEDHTADAKTVEQFRKHLRVDMSYRDLVIFFGEPNRDQGSGIHIYVFVLQDSTEVWIGFTDRLHSARHVGEDQNLLSILI
jgi:ADP-ribose pyrophosphatase YjhB (NUDIX family)